MWYELFQCQFFFSFDSFTATHHASLTGSSEVVMGLIELECDVNAKDKKGDFGAYYRLRKIPLL